jgi:hypothetical protein
MGIMGVTGCLGYLLGFALWIAGFVILIQVWGGLIWVFLWLLFGAAIAFLIADLLRLPFTLLAIGLMMLAGGDPDDLRGRAE